MATRAAKSGFLVGSGTVSNCMLPAEVFSPLYCEPESSLNGDECLKKGVASASANWYPCFFRYSGLSTVCSKSDGGLGVF